MINPGFRIGWMETYLAYLINRKIDGKKHRFDKITSKHPIGNG